MRLGKVLIGLMLGIAVAGISGCGSSGGASDSNGALLLSVTPSTAGMKSVVTAVANYAGTSFNPQGLDIEFSTDRPDLFVGGTAKLSSFGAATFILTPRRPMLTPPSSPILVTVLAKTGDLKQITSFTLRPATIQVAIPTTATVSAGTNPVGTVNRLIFTGMLGKLTDGIGNPVPPGTPVTVSVKNIINGSAGDVIFWKDFPNGTVNAPPNAITQMTDASGQVPMNITVDVVVPSIRPTSEVVNWQIQFNDPDTGAVITTFASTAITIN